MKHWNNTSKGSTLLLFVFISMMCQITCDVQTYVVHEVTGLSKDEEKSIENLWCRNEDMPRPCRTDLCNRGSYDDPNNRKGSFEWSDTQVGYRVQMLCPYAIHEPVFIERWCVLVNDSVEWEMHGDFQDCPDPPLAQLLHTLDIEVNQSQSSPSLEYRAETLLRIQTGLDLYMDYPIDYGDIKRLARYVLDVIPNFRVSNSLLKEDAAYAFLHILDTLMSNSDLRLSTEASFVWEEPENLLLEQLRVLPVLVDSTMYSVRLQHFVLEKATVNPREHQLNITHDTFPSVSIEYNGDMSNGMISVGAMIVKDMNVFYIGGFQDTGFDYPDELTNALTTKSYYPIENTTALLHREVELEPVEYFNYFEQDSGGTYSAYGYMVLTSAMRNDGGTIDGRDLKIMYELVCVDSVDECILDADEREVCAMLRAGGNDSWSRGNCDQHTRPDNTTICLCHGVGFYGGLLHDASREYEIGHSDTEETILIMNERLDIASFMGFPYKKELAILGTVLNAISLCCLLATLLSYLCFSKARRGRTTVILLNLCVALIALSIALFLVEQLVRTKQGCTAANIVRYYLVFVTLLWNTVEAFHMYLMLIKVFPTHISKFALKAGLIAWGLPAVMVGISLAIDLKIFNGENILLSQESEFVGQCIFTCRLRKQMLYYGYLVPMVLIILHNLIIFLLVLRVILKHKQLGSQKRRSRLVQLAGIAATLVLLGVPWIFSAFGALEIKDNSMLSVLEGAFQVVFIVFINLQGVFIFIFHCARNRKMRDSWSSVLSQVTGRTQSTSGNSSTNNAANKHSNEKATRSPETTHTKQAHANQTDS